MSGQCVRCGGSDELHVCLRDALPPSPLVCSWVCPRSGVIYYTDYISNVSKSPLETRCASIARFHATVDEIWAAH